MIAKSLKILGYTVGFNLMQAGGKGSNLIAEKAKLIAEWGSVDVMYFSDSLGSMDGSEVCRIIQSLSSEWTGDLVFHSHNNMGRALDNCIVASREGVKWIDARVSGMGRGVGNCPTEDLLAVCVSETTQYNA